MGLDITAYRQLKPAPEAELDSSGYPIDYGTFVIFQALEWTEKNWPGRTGGLRRGPHSFAEQFRFRAGSYGGYNDWRDELSRFSQGKEAREVWAASSPPGPFVELINFADNEGTIGAAVSAKLAKDFSDNFERATKHAAGSGDEWLISYKNWLKAFELAADGGAVNFH